MPAALQPDIGQKVYDPACGTCGFLVEAYEYIIRRHTSKDGILHLSGEQIRFLQTHCLTGIEKAPLSYAVGVIKMILHFIQAPNIFKDNMLNRDIRQIQESQCYDIILANPPCGVRKTRAFRATSR